MEKTTKLPSPNLGKSGYGHEKKMFKLRQRIRDAYYVHQWTRNRIRCYYRVSSHTVLRWTQDPQQDCTVDRRGWPKGMMRKYTNETLERIRAIHEDLTEDEREFFTGASAVERTWIERYPDPAPPLRTIGSMMRKMHLSATRKKGRGKGAAAYLHYPEHTIYHGLGGRVVESDFIGHKYLAGRTAPLCFQSFSAKQDPKIRAFQRVKAETADVFMATSRWFFASFEQPDFLKMDNAAATVGSMSGKRSVSRVARFLLKKGIVPIYAVPRRPFTQASVEGSNSMFARRFWNVREFSGPQEVDEQLEWFNDAICRYHGYEPPVNNKQSTNFRPRMYFIRQVREAENGRQMGTIKVQVEDILLPIEYVKYFVIAEWDLEKEHLLVHFESDKNLTTIHEQPFPISGKELSL